MELQRPQTGELSVYLWNFRACDDVTLTTLEQSLSDEERAYSSSFAHAENRDRTTFCRGLLRLYLGAMLNTPAADVMLHLNTNGKPLLPPGHHNLFFNYSHSGDYAAFAFSNGAEVGVDLEYMARERDIEGIARHFFHGIETRQLMALDGDERRHRFYQYWTLKEAYLKARGEGVFAGLDRFSFSIPANATEGIRITFHAPGQGYPRHWHFVSAAPLPDYQLALAVASPGPRPVSVNVQAANDLAAIPAA